MRGPIPQTEAQFQDAVVDLARLHGWNTLHIPPTQLQGAWLTAATAGWVDLLLWRPGNTVLFRELKTNKGRVTRTQQAVLDSLTESGADAGVWRPSDWGLIVATLQQRPTR